MRFDQFILPTINSVPYGIKVVYDKDVFNKMVDFILSLEPNQLTNSQLNAIAKIVEMFKMVPSNEKVEEEDTGSNLILKNRQRIINKYL